MKTKHPYQDIEALNPDESVKHETITRRLFVKATDANFQLTAVVVKRNGESEEVQEIALPRPASEYPSGTSPIPVQCLNKLDTTLELLYEHLMDAKLEENDMVSIEVMGTRHAYEAVLSLINILKEDRPEINVVCGSFIDTRNVESVRTKLAIQAMEASLAKTNAMINELGEL